MRAMKSVLIVTRMGYIEGVFTSFRALANSRGAITQQPFSRDGKSAYVLSSKFVPVSGWWNDKAEVREWQERTRAYKALKELKRKGEDLKLEKAIKPLREVYARVNPSMRSIFIAQVVYLLIK